MGEENSGVDDTPVKEAIDISTIQDKILKKIGTCFGDSTLRDGTAKIAKVQPGAMVHFYIEMLKDGSIALEIMDRDGEPTGKIIEEGMTWEQFAQKYKTCSNHKCTLRPRTVDEVAKKMSATRAKMGEQQLKRGNMEEAEEKFERAINLDEGNVRASFGLGKAQMEQGKVDEAMEVFNKISSGNTIYDESEKHTFNEFGIYLRKNEIYDISIENYEKAIYISPDDEVLYFNLARAYKDNGDIEIAIGKLRECRNVTEDQMEKSSDAEKSGYEKFLALIDGYLELYLEAEKMELGKLFQSTSNASNNDDNEKEAEPVQAEPPAEETAKRKRSLEMDVDYENNADGDKDAEGTDKTDSSDKPSNSDDAGDGAGKAGIDEPSADDTTEINSETNEIDETNEYDEEQAEEEDRQALEELLGDDFDEEEEV